MKHGRTFPVTVGIAVFVVGMYLFIAWYSNPVIVHVENRTGQAMMRVIVSTRDEARNRDAIPASAQWTLTLHPKQESGIEVRYINGNGNPCEGKVEAYLERGVRGTVDVQVLGCHQLTFQASVGVSLL
jgi:hypothetical protein